MKLKSAVKIISLILCFSIFGSTVANASGNMVELSQERFISEDIASESVTSQAKKAGEEYSVMLPFAFIHTEATPFSSFSILVYGQEITFLSEAGLYSYVKTENDTKGYILSVFLSSGNGNRSEFKINEYMAIYKGRSKSLSVKGTTDIDSVSWTVGDSSIISFDSKTLQITGLKPGITTLTARLGLFKSSKCTVTVINEWKETEYATSDKRVSIKMSAGNTHDTLATIEKGTPMIAKGDLADGNGWIYISAKNDSFWGFIKVSDFPGIDHLMTQYHYYDQGYEKRFSPAKTKIYDYASVLNDVMMANFKLKVCPYVELYISAADQCKIMSYGSVKANNLANACPKTQGHGSQNSASCLTTINLRENLKNTYGNGGGTVSKTVWTGHIMTNHDDDRSNSTVGVGTIIFTPYATVNPNTYTNYDQSRIKKERLYTLVHETSHQLGVYDHYCAGDISAITNKCSNSHCSRCNGENIPKGCIMYERIEVENTEFTKLYCEKCRENISKNIENF